jgi:hypothetical protein
MAAIGIIPAYVVMVFVPGNNEEMKPRFQSSQHSTIFPGENWPSLQTFGFDHKLRVSVFG